MTVYNPGLEADLNNILTILGTTKTHLWPFYESAGITVSGVGVGADLIPSNAGAAEALEDDFNPALLPGGIYAYHFQPGRPTSCRVLLAVNSYHQPVLAKLIDCPFYEVRIPDSSRIYRDLVHAKVK